jgi:hypothetical protein
VWRCLFVCLVGEEEEQHGGIWMDGTTYLARPTVKKKTCAQFAFQKSWFQLGWQPGAFGLG